jgi:NADH:ubiquinone oxidoreductase subunit E
MVKVKVCCGLDCVARGGQELLAVLEEDERYAGKLVIEPIPCLHCCEDGALSPVVEIDGTVFTGMTPERLLEILGRMTGTEC